MTIVPWQIAAGCIIESLEPNLHTATLLIQAAQDSNSKILG